MVFGWLGILYGLSWWQSVSAILVGTLIAAAFVSASALLGWRAATNNSVSSGAFFGVRGRLIASFVGLLLCIQYVALTIWTGGEMISAGLLANGAKVCISARKAQACDEAAKRLMDTYGGECISLPANVAE